MLPHITLGSKGMRVNLTMAWAKMTYAWSEEQATLGQAAKPIIVDADDLMDTGSEELVRKLAVLLGGDPTELIFNWNAVVGDELEEVQPYAKVFESTLLASSTVVASKRGKGVAVERETQGWVAEFGQEEAKVLKGFVEGAMEDYEHLKARSLKR